MKKKKKKRTREKNKSKRYVKKTRGGQREKSKVVEVSWSAQRSFKPMVVDVQRKKRGAASD